MQMRRRQCLLVVGEKDCAILPICFHREFASKEIKKIRLGTITSCSVLKFVSRDMHFAGSCWSLVVWDGPTGVGPSNCAVMRLQNQFEG